MYFAISDGLKIVNQNYGLVFSKPSKMLARIISLPMTRNIRFFLKITPVISLQDLPIIFSLKSLLRLVDRIES